MSEPNVDAYELLRAECRKLKEENGKLVAFIAEGSEAMGAMLRARATLEVDLKTAQLNASAAVKLAQDREKELQESRHAYNAIEKERDALKAEMERIRPAHRDDIIAELGACKRERDEARECARKESDLRHAQVEKLESEARRYRKVIDEQKEQLTEKSALCERLQVFVRGIHTLTPRHREKLDELLQRAEGQP